MNANILVIRIIGFICRKDVIELGYTLAKIYQRKGYFFETYTR